MTNTERFLGTSQQVSNPVQNWINSYANIYIFILYHLTALADSFNSTHDSMNTIAALHDWETQTSFDERFQIHSRAECDKVMRDMLQMIKSVRGYCVPGGQVSATWWEGWCFR